MFLGGESAKYYAGMLSNHHFCVIASHVEVLHFVEIKNASSLKPYIQIRMQIRTCFLMLFM